jgi:F-type H+-transporting ATPase subunit epsilon
VKIHQNADVRKAAIHSGFAEILPESVTILAEIAEWPEEIDVNRANEARIRAERRLASNDANINMLRAELALKRSLARLGAVD